MDQKLLSIGEVSKLSGVHIKSLRYYDEIGVLKPAYINPKTNYRYYEVQQLIVLDIIKFCIELNIPLKQIQNFVKHEEHTIEFKKMFELGRKIAEEKIKTIQKGLDVIELLETELEESTQFSCEGITTIIDMRKKYYYIVPIKDLSDESGYRDSFIETLYEAMNTDYTLGYRLNYKMGKLYYYKKNICEKYDFIEVIVEDGVKINDEHILEIPAGKYMAKCVKESRIEYAEEEFEDVFLLEGNKVVFETEILSEKFNYEKPIFQLSCYVEASVI